ncbi:translocation/assembly module TamB domain-containing protein [Rhodopila sp.]|uniref:translocation/assembly module TamB domain-containing protein n=1 Tax=Rhodopila sp. TaxID=2480087 RepID=UPI003D0AD244
MIVVAVLIALPLLVVVVVLIGANTGPGRHLIQTETASLTGGMVRIQDLTGRFPDALRIGLIQVSDAKGRYVVVQNLVLDWSPLKLLGRTAQVDQLSATKVDFSRLPVSSGSSRSSGGSFNLPVRVDLRHLHVDAAMIGAPVAGTAATLVLDGSGELQTLTEGTVHLDVRRLDSPGRYDVDGAVTADHVQATVRADEPAKGLISSVASLPDLGAITVQASISGPRDGLVTQADLSAGPLKAAASGTVDLVHEAADLTLKAEAPAMAPAPGVSWNGVQVNAHVNGPFGKPDATGMVDIQSLAAGGAKIGALNANVSGNAGHIELHATVADLHVPGPKPDLLAAAPVVLDVSAQLAAPARPVMFTLHHPLIAIDGSATTGSERQGHAHLVLPDLAPFAAAAGVDIRGGTDLDLRAEMAGGTTTVAATGKVSITGGMTPVPALIGPDGRIDLAASMHGEDVTLSHLTISGRALNVSAQGGVAAQVVDLDWALRLSDLAAVQPALSGSLDAKGHAAGKTDDLAVRSDLDADLAAKGFRSGHIMAHLDATGLPAAPHASVTADGTLLDAPLSLALSADRTDGAVHAAISRATWKSFQAEGAVNLPAGATLPVGSLRINLAHLADFAPLLGRPMAGQAAVALNADDKAAHLAVTVRDAAIPGTAAVGKALLNATVTDPTNHPAIDGTFTADGVSAGSAKGASARLTAKGPLDAVGLTVAANAPALAGGPARVETAGVLNVQDRTLALGRMAASWKGEVVRLLAPAKLAFADGVLVDRLRLGFRQAELSVSGGVGSKLDLTAALRNLPADVAAIADPALAADGMINAAARLTGTTASPEGTVKLTAAGVRLREGAGRAIPAANLTVDVGLLGSKARLNSALTAGQSHFAAVGMVPLSSTGALDLKTDGRVDLAMLNPLLAAQGRRARGEVTLNAAVAGTVAAPKIDGKLVLTNGDVADYVVGAHVTDLAATIEANGDTIRLAQFSGKAAPGTLGGSGTISLKGAMPVDLHFTADNARPVSSDLLTALIDANITVQGEVKGDLQAGGTLHVRRADIRIPDKLPASVAVLPVRDPNAPPPAPPETSNSNIALNLTLDAPGQVFIRGHGLNAELGGLIHVTGTASKPIPDGGLHLRQGTLSVIGTTLNFTSGTIDFSGAGITDPSLHFVATSTTSTLVATLTISGSAKDPKIALSSVPEMPQDEILAQLLFNTSASKLGPLQLAQIAAALASLSGATSGAGDPLDKLRTAVGLDRLSVGSDSAGNPTLQAGRYVARGVYVGAQQSASGNGTQATVQVDIAKGLKLQTTAGSGTTDATGSTSSGDAASVGMTYQFEY